MSRSGEQRPADLERLLSAGLPPALRAAVEEAARAASGPLYLVGGVVRDLLLGRPVADVDLLVEGDAKALAGRLAERLGGRLTVHAEFGAARVETAEGVRLDLMSARRERYPAPAALPEVEPGSLDDDLRRRDFTVNALAVRLGDDGGPALIDRCGGVGDLERRTLRVLHDRSFFDDPTRILRGVRYEVRLGLGWAPETEALARQAVAAGIFERLSGDRLRGELARLLEEPRGPTAGLARLADLGVLGSLHADLRWTPEVRARLARAARTLPALRAAARGPFAPRSWLAYLLALLRGQPAAAVEGVVETLALAGDERRLTLRSEDPVGAALAVLAVTDLPPHRAAAVLRPLADEELVLLGAVGDEAASRWVRAEVERFRAFALSIDGDDLVRRGARPGPALGRALERTRDARLDGTIGAEEELDHALELLRRAGERVS